MAGQRQPDKRGARHSAALHRAAVARGTGATAAVGSNSSVVLGHGLYVCCQVPHPETLPFAVSLECRDFCDRLTCTLDKSACL